MQSVMLFTTLSKAPTTFCAKEREGMMSQEKKSILRPTVYSSVAQVMSCTVVLPGQQAVQWCCLGDDANGVGWATSYTLVLPR